MPRGIACRFQPDGPAKHIGVIIEGYRRAWPAALHLALADFVRIIQIVAAVRTETSSQRLRPSSLFSSAPLDPETFTRWVSVTV